MSGKSYTINTAGEYHFDDKMKTMVTVSDLQIPYQDDVTLEVVDEFLADFQPDTFVMNGDINDFAGLSKYRLTLEQRQSVQDELAELQRRLAVWRSIMPNTKMVYIMGNHEARLEAYLVDHAPELEFLSDGELSFANLAGLADLDIELVAPYGAAYDWYGFLITHGTLVRTNTAKANYEKEGSSGLSGHTHRASSFFKTDRSGPHAWYEGGCLCMVDAPNSPPPTNPGVNNWQQMIIVGYAWGYNRWNIYPVSITEHEFVWNGKLYAPRA